MIVIEHGSVSVGRGHGPLDGRSPWEEKLSGDSAEATEGAEGVQKVQAWLDRHEVLANEEGFASTEAQCVLEEDAEEAAAVLFLHRWRLRAQEEQWRHSCRV